MLYGLILLIGINTVFGSDSGKVNNSPQIGQPIGSLRRVERTQTAVVAEYDSGRARMEIFKTGIVHFTIQRGDMSRESFAVIEKPDSLSEHEVASDGNRVSISLDDGVVSYQPGSVSISYAPKRNSNPLDLLGIQFSDSGVTATFDIHGARNFYGLGEKTLPYNKYGSRATMWNSDFPAYSAKLDPLYESIPFLLKADTSGAYGLFFDNTFRSHFDVGASDSDRLIYKAAGGAFELYIITGKNAAEVVQRFSELTGRMHMPPIWALGYQQSRWSYYPEQKVLDLAHGFRDRKIPCDVIYLDINYMDGYRCFTWSPTDFPTPKNMLDTLHDMGFKVVTIIDPGIKDDSAYSVYESGMKKDVFVKKPDGKYFIGQVWPGDCVFPDFLNAKAREWWGGQYKPLVDTGVDGFWNDMNEPSVFNTSNKTFPLDAVHKLDGGTAAHAEVHNVYGMEMARGTREGLEKLEPNKRPFVLTRANYAGGQRYAAMWTGDNFASFAHLKLALAIFLNIGVSGQPFVGSDIGGFIGNPSAELFSRWLELGSFSPFFRTHSVMDSKPREPWAFCAGGASASGGDSANIDAKSCASTKINREIIERRYELLPEIYTAFKSASEDGLPIVRPLYLNFPDDGEAYNISDEFLFGDNLLVAPVLDSDAVSREVYLPRGNWTSLSDGRQFMGGWHKVDAPIGKTPVFVQDGTALFTQSLIQSTSEQADTIMLKIFGDKSATGRSYFDDGESMAYKGGAFLNVDVSSESRADGVALRFKTQGSFKPKYKFLTVEMPMKNGLHEALMRTLGGSAYRSANSSQKKGLLKFTFPFTPDVESILVY
jgi:alpha-glucosidase